MALVRSTISLAHALGLRVVAEGVEDEASLDLLVGFECDLAQGYLISEPKPATELALSRYGLPSADWPAASERPAPSRETKTAPSHSREILPTDAPRFGDAAA